MHGSFDVLVLGGTPGGISAALRAARSGMDTLLVSYNASIGGMLSGGMCSLETYYERERAPILREFKTSVEAYYADRYGRDSSQYAKCLGGYSFEPHVAERIFDEMVDSEPALTVQKEYHLLEVTRTEKLIESLTLQSVSDPGDRPRVRSDVFIDATYQGDLAAEAGAPYRIGREGRAEFNEQLAGRMYVSVGRQGFQRGESTDYRLYNRDAVGRADTVVPAGEHSIHESFDIPEEYRQGELDVVPSGVTSAMAEILSGSTGAADDSVQAYNYRVVLTDDPENRVRPSRPATYDRSEYVDLSTAGMKVLYKDDDEIAMDDLFLFRPKPNDKFDVNSGDLPGENRAYPDGDWELRDRIAKRHRDYWIGLLYFLQNDDSVPDRLRTEARRWGFPRDEFPETGNFPHQLYIREARRIRGRETHTENDVRVGEGLGRAPINESSIAITERMINSHACRDDFVLGSQRDGHLLNPEVTRPGQLGFGTLLPEGIANLLVPVALSATHIGFSALRFEPTWMHIGESAGVVASVALKEDVPPGDLPHTRVQRALLEEDVMISFINEHADVDEELDRALQYLSTKGFFRSYSTNPEAPVTAETLDVWVDILTAISHDTPYSATAKARELPAGNPSDDHVDWGAFQTELESAIGHVDTDAYDGVDSHVRSGEELLRRGDAARAMYDILTRVS